MLKIADYLNGAIRSGKAATVKYIVHALMYGVEEGHNALLADEVPKAKEILAEREDRFEKYKKVVDYSRTIDDYWRNIVNCEKSLQQVTAELKDRKKKVEDELDKDHRLAEELKKYFDNDDNDIDKLSQEAKILVVEVKNTITLNEQCMLLKQRICLDYEKIFSIEQMISQVIEMEKLGFSQVFQYIDIVTYGRESKQQRAD